MLKVFSPLQQYYKLTFNKRYSNVIPKEIKEKKKTEIKKKLCVSQKKNQFELKISFK